MNREMKFRGKTIESSIGWIYGDLIQSPGIIPVIQRFEKTIEIKGEKCQQFSQDKVHPQTVGQFTGIKDGNGTEIFEGDIIEVTLRHNNTIVSTYNAIVDQKEGAFGFKNKQGFCPFYGQIHENYKVIGNIHDNPELMEGGAQ